jgi:hypothetical protein
MLLDKKNSNFMHGFKSAILAIFQFFPNGTFEHVYEILIFFLSKSILLKYYENGNEENFSIHVPGSTKSRIYAGKSTKRGFSKKALMRIEKKIVLGSYEFLEYLEG